MPKMVTYRGRVESGAAGARETQSRTVAVVGTGAIGLRHVEVLSSIEGVRPIRVPIRPGRAQGLARNGLPATSTLDQAVRGGATLCVVATDTGRHAHDAVAAMEQGCHVLVEKPLARNAEEARQVTDQAIALNRQLFVGCVLRFSASLNIFREWLPQVGRLHAVRIECQTYLPDWRPARSYRDSYSARAGEGGVLRDLIHEIDYAGWIFGWPEAVQASVRNLGRLGIEADEVADVMWHTREGCSVSVSLDYLTRPLRRRLRAAGALGTLEWNGGDGTVTLERPGCPTKIEQRRETPEAMLAAQARAFLSAIEGTVDARLATGLDGVNALAVCDAARRASEQGRVEPVTYSAEGR